MDLGLEGRSCIVLGASRGIGRAIAERLAGEGANLAICAREPDGLADAAESLRSRGVRVHAAACDVGDPAALASFLDGARQALGRIDVLIHNASALAIGPDAEAWQASLQVDLMGGVRACEQVIPWMAESGGGSVLLVSSIAALEAWPMTDFGYTVAKAGQVAYAKKLAILHGSQHIRVNAIAPGSIEFPGGIWAGVKEQQPALYGAVKASIPRGRLGTPEEVADVAVFLVSDRAKWVTGECVAVDGGQHKAMR